MSEETDTRFTISVHIEVADGIVVAVEGAFERMIGINTDTDRHEVINVTHVDVVAEFEVFAIEIIASVHFRGKLLQSRWCGNHVGVAWGAAALPMV